MRKIYQYSSVRASDLCAFTRQLATMLQAGIPLASALKITIDSAAKKSVANLATKIKAQLEAGFSLAEALRAHPRQFNNLYCNLIEAGEVSGQLDFILERIANYLEKNELLKRKLKKAAYYPALVIVVALIVILILTVKVIPTFKTMFAGLNAELPAFTQQILSLSDTIQRHWLTFMLCGALLTWLSVKLYRGNIRFKTKLQRIALRLPIFGKILHKVAITEFASTLSTTSAAGVALPKALLLTAKANGNLVYYEAIIRIRDLVTRGETISLAMRSTQLFNPLVIQMVIIGEQSGSLESILLKISETYAAEVDLAMDGLATMLEPLIMLILGVIVGGLVIAMYLPIFKLGTVF